jgi:DNA-binding CsgD family transcriptional regulator
MFGAKQQVPQRLHGDLEAAPAMRRLKQSRTKFMNEPIDLLRCHFGLTPAEARLALQLVAGETLRAAAVKLSITYETARTELKNIFNKTGTCRQAELVIVIVTAVPRLRWSNPLTEPAGGLAQKNKSLASSNKSPEGSQSD